VGSGQWPLGTNSAQFIVYRLHEAQLSNCQDGCRPIPEGMTIFCLVSFTTGAVRSAMPATAGFLVSTDIILLMNNILISFYDSVGVLLHCCIVC